MALLDVSRRNSVIDRVDDISRPLGWLCATHESEYASLQMRLVFRRLVGGVFVLNSPETVITVSEDLTAADLRHIVVHLKMQG
jgi:hypothetical protein